MVPLGAPAPPLPRAELQELVTVVQDAPAPPVVTCSDQEFDEWLLGRNCWVLCPQLSG